MRNLVLVGKIGPAFWPNAQISAYDVTVSDRSFFFAADKESALSDMFVTLFLNLHERTNENA